VWGPGWPPINLVDKAEQEHEVAGVRVLPFADPFIHQRITRNVPSTHVGLEPDNDNGPVGETQDNREVVHATPLSAIIIQVLGVAGGRGLSKAVGKTRKDH
jgi:hypothetical protein